MTGRPSRVCFSCGGAEQDGACLPARKPIRGHLLCTGCDAAPEAERAERIRQRLAQIARGNVPRSRRSYRAALRHRQQSPQDDLVDLVVHAP